MSRAAGTAPQAPLESIGLGLLSLSIVLTLVPSTRAQSENGLIGHWKLDDNGPRELVADSSPSQWHGTCSANRAECSVPGKHGRAFRFPAAGTISLDRHAPALGKLTSFTLSMWIQYDGGESRQLFTFNDGTMNYRIQVEVHQNQLHFGWQNGGSFTGFGTPSLTWKPGTWYHVVFVNDRKTGKSILRSNDLVWKTDTNTLAPADLKSPVKRVAIGSLNGGYSFNGCVTDVRLFNRALPLSEQLALEEEVNGWTDEPGRTAAKAALIEQQRRKQMTAKIREQFLAEEGSSFDQERTSAKSRVAFSA